MFGRRIVFFLVVLGLTGAFILGKPVDGRAQIILDEATSVFPEDFGAIQTVRELPDGRVLLADPLGKALFLVDMAAGTRTVIGQEGEGPEEYRQPDAVWPLRGDSTLLVDLGNGRLVVLGPDLSFGRTRPITVGTFQPGQTLVLAIPQGVDGSGRIYSRAMGGGLGGGAYPDSAAILRIDAASEAVDTVSTFKIQGMTESRSGGAANQSVQISPIPLSPEDAWGVASDGSLVLARSADYHLEWFNPDGSVTRGAPVPYDPVRIGTPEKEEYLDELGRSGGGISVGVEMVNGRMSMSFARGGAQTRARELDQYPWPDAKPPFYSGRIPVDPQNHAWVRRHVDAGEGSTYDVFDRQGNLVETVILGSGKRVVGFGTSAIYVVSFDEFDLNYLERYALPSI